MSTNMQNSGVANEHIAMETSWNFGLLNPQERLGRLKEIPQLINRSANSNAIQIQRGIDQSLQYLHIRHSKTPTPVKIQSEGILMFDTGSHDDLDPKLHLNVAEDKVAEVVALLSDLQDELHSNPDPKTNLQNKTFYFKVALDDRAYGDSRPLGGWPPRIVIYPSILSMYPDFAYSAKTQPSIKQLIELIRNIKLKLNQIDGWDNTKYRARYSNKIDIPDTSDGSIEIVVGNTNKQGDNSGR